MGKIIGHNNILNRIKKRSENESFSHATLIVGNEGIGKSLLAKYLGNEILSKNADCESVDLVNYSPKKKSFGVDDVRMVVEEINKRPYEGDKKVVILYSCDKMTVQAQNALLKTIEEPPKGVYIILLSDSLEIMLETVQSRCQVYKLTPLIKNEMLDYIETKYPNLPMDRKQAALAYGMGIPGKVDKFLKDENLTDIRYILICLLEDILQRNKDFVVKYGQLLNKFKLEKYDLLDILLLYIRDILILKEVNNKELIINYDKVDELEKISNKISYNRLNNMIECIEETRINFNSNSNYSMTVNVLLMGFLEV